MLHSEQKKKQTGKQKNEYLEKGGQKDDCTKKLRESRYSP